MGILLHLVGIVYGAKLYPAGATTNSDLGVTSIDKIKHVLQVFCWLLALSSYSCVL